MKTLWFILGLGLFFTNNAVADMMPPPPAQFAVSQDGSKIVRLSYEKPSDFKSAALLTVFEFDAKKNAYLPARSIRTDRQELGQFMFVSDDGRFVALASVSFNPGLRLFDGGKPAKSWKLDELITETEAAACIQTGSTLQWLDQGGFHGDKFYFSGPAKGVRGWGSSFTVMRGHDASVSYNFSLDLSKLELKKTTPRAP